MHGFNVDRSAHRFDLAMSSRHLNAGLLIGRGLYDNLQSFADLEQRISALGDENTKVVGDAFEIFVEKFRYSDDELRQTLRSF